MSGINQKNHFLYEFAVIMVMLNAFGFAGNFAKILGNWFGTLVDYSAFGLEFLVMIVSSGSNVMEVRLLNLRKRYRALYLTIIVIFTVSMLVSRYKSLEFITCFRLSATVLFALWISDNFSVREIVKLTCVTQAIFIGLTFFYTIINPGRAFNAISGETAFVGLYPTKNTAADELVIGICLYVVYWRMHAKQLVRIPRWFQLTLIIQFIMLIMSRCTGALITCTVVVFILTVFTGREGHMRKIPLGWMFILGSIGFLIFALTIIPLFAGILEMLGKDATLTGRTLLWRQIIQVMQNHNTFTGFGYAMFWRNPTAIAYVHAGFDRNSFMGTMTAGAHNLLMEFWQNNGLIGIGVLFLAMLDSMRRINTTTDDEYLFCAAVFLVLMICGFTERSISGGNSYHVLFLFLAMAVGCNRQAFQDPMERKAAAAEIGG